MTSWVCARGVRVVGTCPARTFGTISLGNWPIFQASINSNTPRYGSGICGSHFPVCSFNSSQVATPKRGSHGSLKGHKSRMHANIWPKPFKPTVDWTSQYCWTNGWNCLWRGHSVYRNRPLIPPSNQRLPRVHCECPPIPTQCNFWYNALHVFGKVCSKHASNPVDFKHPTL